MLYTTWFHVIVAVIVLALAVLFLIYIPAHP
jgi:hypothetical protein